MNLKEKDRNVQFYTNENKEGKISELVMIAWQWGRFLALSLTGDIDLNDISRAFTESQYPGL